MAHGGNLVEASNRIGVSKYDIIDFSASINDFIDLKDIFIKRDDIKIYPQGIMIKNKSICEFENVVNTPGLTFFIHRLLSYVNGNIIIIEPTFKEYNSAFTYGNRINIPFNVVNQNPEIIKNYNFSLVIIVYPDNPLGNMISRESLLRISNICMERSSMLFIDESFIFFSKKRYDDDELLNKNTLIGRSLTKILGIPGLRLGYIAGDKHNINLIKNIVGPWSVADYVIEYANSISINYDFLKELDAEKQFMIKSLENMNFKAIGEHIANYITFKLPDGISGIKLYNYLLKNMILIRLLNDYDCLGENYIRVTIRKHELNKKLIDNIRRFLHENDSGSWDII